MRPITVSRTGTGVSSPVVLNYNAQPFNVGIGVTVSGTATYTVQHTFDDPFASTFSAATANWFAHDDVSLSGSTVGGDGNYAYPCTASRVNVSAGTGTVTVTYIQTGPA